MKKTINYALLILLILAVMVGCSNDGNNKELEEKITELENIINEKDSYIKELEEEIDIKVDEIEELKGKNEQENIEEIEENDEVNKNNLSKEDAEGIFKENYPNSDIRVSKLQGDIYYLEGNEGNNINKMKIKVSDGSIIFQKTITKGR